MIDELLLLGSGGHVPTERRETCCALLRSGPRALVIDAGTGLRHLVTDPQLLAGVEAIDLVLTHFHLDHVVGLSYLCATSLPAPTLWGPGLAFHGTPTERVLAPLFSNPLFALRLDQLVAGVEELPLGRLELGPFALRTRRQARHSHPTLALRIGDEVAYCTDTAYDEGNVELAAGVRVLCHEAWATEAAGAGDTHSTGREAGVIARLAGAGSLVLIHVNPRVADEAALLAQARAEHPAALLGEDLLRLVP